MAKIFIVEDDANQLFTLTHKVESLNHQVVGSSSRAMDALIQIKKLLPDMILLDINLNGDNDGLMLGAEIQEMLGTKIIYVTASNADDVLKQAATTHPVAYILKPIKTSELKIAIELALASEKTQVNTSEISQSKSKILTVRLGNYLYNIDVDNIAFLDAGGKNYTNLTTLENKKYQIRTSLKQLKERMLPNFFVQVHRRYIVNMNHINYIKENDQLVYLKNDEYISIGKTYKKELYEKLNLY